MEQLEARLLKMYDEGMQNIHFDFTDSFWELEPEDRAKAILEFLDSIENAKPLGNIGDSQRGNESDMQFEIERRDNRIQGLDNAAKYYCDLYLLTLDKLNRAEANVKRAKESAKFWREAWQKLAAEFAENIGRR